MTPGFGVRRAVGEKRHTRSLTHCKYDEYYEYSVLYSVLRLYYEYIVTQQEAMVLTAPTYLARYSSSSSTRGSRQPHPRYLGIQVPQYVLFPAEA